MFRTPDGTCNNFDHPSWGSAFMPFLRFLPPDYRFNYFVCMYLCIYVYTYVCTYIFIGIVRMIDRIIDRKVDIKIDRWRNREIDR